MKGFKKYLKEDEEVQRTLKKLPAAFRRLVAGYEFQFEPRNTLSGDAGHVGFVKMDDKVVRVAAPWNHGRDFTVLHEIGHVVYEKLVRGTKWEGEWERALKGVDTKKGEPPEELWCHFFANRYVKYPHAVFEHPKCDDYFRRFVAAG